jgi:hypothetical protein
MLGRLGWAAIPFDHLIILIASGAVGLLAVKGFWTGWKAR